MSYAGRHSAADAARRAPAVSELLTIIAVPALIGLSIYALLFMLNAVEKQMILACGVIAILGGFAAFARRKIVTMLSLLPTTGLPLLLHWLGWRTASVPAPVVFALMLCAVAYVGLIAGLIIGAMVFERDSSDGVADLHS
jgi:uncharacterized membrane protein